MEGKCCRRGFINMYYVDNKRSFPNVQSREGLADWALRGFDNGNERSTCWSTVLCGEGDGIWPTEMGNESEGDMALAYYEGSCAR